MLRISLQRFAQHDTSQNNISKTGQDAFFHSVAECRIIRSPAKLMQFGVAYTFVGVAAFAGLLGFPDRRKRSMQPLGKPAVAFALRNWFIINDVVNLCGLLCFTI